MSKKISKIFTYLLLTVLAVVGLGNVANSVAEAAGPTTNVVIHKIETDATADEREYDISQPITDLGTHFGQAAVPLEGVSFTWYKVDDAAKYAEMIATPGKYATTADVVAYLGAEVTGTSTDETNASGEVTILNLAEGNYWVVENTKGTIASSEAVPFGLTLPFTNADGTGYYETIHVYPKNTLQDEPVDPVKTVNKPNNAIGEVHTWTISQNIPVGIEEYHEFKFTDAIDSRLDWVGNVTVTAAGVVLGAGDYTVVFNDDANQTSKLLPGKSLTGILTVEFTEQGRKSLANASGLVKITFETKINNTAIMGQEIENNVQVDFDNGHGRTGEKTPDEVPSVHTGGKKFVKVDQANEEVLLAGAEFKIKNAAGDFVIIGTDGAVTFGVEADAEVFTSAEVTGAFEVRGLPHGDYVLVETKAPDGYALPTDPNTPFTVNADSYEDAAVLKIDNKEITIPQTGGIGTAIFTVIGVALMTISVVSYKRTSEA